MGSEHYCLRWNNHQSNLLGVFSQLLESESLVDVTLACTEGPSIRAHKVVLSACSSYFQTLFLDHPNRHPIVILKDVRFAELRTLVDFMYKGEVNVEYCQLSALLKTAESLKVKGLADMTNINAAALQQPHTGTPGALKLEDTSESSPVAPSSGTVVPSVPPTMALAARTTSPTSNAAAVANSTSSETNSSRTQDGPNDRHCAKDNNGLRERNSDRDRDRDCRDRDRDRDKPDREKRSRSRSRDRKHLHHHHHHRHHRHLHNDTRTRTTSPAEDEEEQPAESNECPTSPAGATTPTTTTTTSARRPAAPTSPCPGPLALDRPRSRRDSDSAASLEETRGSVSPLSVHSGPSDMSLSNNTGGGGTVTPVTIPASAGLTQSRLPSPHSTEPLAGPSGLPPVQQVPLSLKKEVDWDRTEERSASSEMSTDYRLPPDPVSLALGLEPASWAGSGLSPADLENSGLLSSAGFAAGLAGLARRCGVCLASFPSTWLLERHAILQHAGQPGDDKPFTCEQCGQRYRYRSAYVKHREQNHRARLPADKLFTCDVCGMQFRYLKSFKKHRLNHALERLQRAPSNESQALTERSDQVSSTGEPSQLETGSVGDGSPLRVDSEPDRDPLGGRDTPSEGAREEAASSETASVQDNPNDSAELLDASGATNLTIRLRSSSHLLSSATTAVTSDPEDEDPRPELDASTTTTLNLSIHQRAAPASSQPQPALDSAADRRERRFACPFCGKCVRSKENLKLHMRKHTGERPFVCLFCGRAFGGKSDLTRHLRIHTGERPYHCEMCGKSFARADYLSKHLTTHIHQR